jgi:hypothetical protein
MAVIALGCLLAACSGDEEEITFDQTAGEGIVGKYIGEWIQHWTEIPHVPKVLLASQKSKEITSHK